MHEHRVFDPANARRYAESAYQCSCAVCRQPIQIGGPVLHDPVNRCYAHELCGSGRTQARPINVDLQVDKWKLVFHVDAPELNDPCRVFEDREQLQNGVWAPVSEARLVMEDTFHAVQYNACALWRTLLAKRINQGFRMQNDASSVYEREFAAISGTTSTGYRTRLSFMVVEPEKEVNPFADDELDDLIAGREGELVQTIINDEPHMRNLGYVGQVEGDPFHGPGCMGSCCNGSVTEEDTYEVDLTGSMIQGSRNAVKHEAKVEGFKEQARASRQNTPGEAQEGRGEATDAAERAMRRAAPDGIYTVEYDGWLKSHAGGREYRVLKLETQPLDANFAPGEQVIYFQTGADNENDYAGFGFLKPDARVISWKKWREAAEGRFVEEIEHAVSALIGDPKAAGLAYARQSGNCWRCGRTLTVPASLNAGLGPVCATKMAEMGF